MPTLQHTGVTRAVVALACVAFITGAAAAQSHYEGAIGPGSSYEIDVPATWNGDLVLYAHGIVQAEQPVVTPSLQDGYAAIRAALLARGYAVAASSYSSNGWALADAVQRTHQLSGIFRSKVGLPHRTLLMGHSMGALAIVKMAETFRGQYDGALPMCGPLGGALAEVQYAGHARVTFDYYFPGVLPGGPFDLPEGIPYESNPPSPLFQRVFGAFLANPAAVQQWAVAAGIPFANSSELFPSTLYVVGFLWRYTNDLIERVNGKLPFDNRTTVYQVNVSPDSNVNAALSAQLNAGVARFDADRAAVNYYQRNYQPNGRIEIPILTLHGTRDNAVPFWHERMYADIVNGAGRSDLLVQRSVNSLGHCAITPAEALSAFTALEGWVATGVRP